MRPPRKPLLESATTAAIIDSFRDVHRALGFGFRERIYAMALERDLIAKGHSVTREAHVMVYYRGLPLAPQRIDMLVDGRVIVENKASAQLNPQAKPQLVSYLAATDIEVGLLLHYGPEARFYRVVFENRLKRRETPHNNR